MSVTTYGALPYVSRTQNENGEIHLDNGTFVEIFNELSELLNFSYTVTTPPDGEWGSKKDDGTWSGMVGQLETKIVDIGRLNYYFRSVYCIIGSGMCEVPIYFHRDFHLSHFCLQK